MFTFGTDALKSETTLAREAAEAVALAEAAAVSKAKDLAKAAAAAAKAAAKVDPDAIYAKSVERALSSNKLTPSLPAKVESLC